MKFFALFVAALLACSPAFANPVDDVIAIDAGSDTGVGGFSADMGFNGGGTYTSADPVNTSNAVDPANELLYRSNRFGGSFSYILSGLQAGSVYRLRLHFAEVYWDTGGARLFNVSANGDLALTNFDVFSAAGGKNIAVIREIEAEANDLGNIVLQFSAITDNALISGIEVQLATAVPPQPSPSYNLSLGADKASYAAGQVATVMVSLYNLPENPRYEFYVSAAYNGADLPLTRITDTQLFAVTPALASGDSQVVASLFLQDKNEAAALEQSIAHYTAEISRLTDALGQATDPGEIAAIQAEIARDQASLDATKDHLNHVRTPVGVPVSITLTAQ